ncbi:DegV family EDD domain-containing protein [Clostridia bacterium]|nr:DegV family EDD domain-containing protein [Clostridia bacterium]
MEKEYIDGFDIYNFIVSGAHRLIAEEQDLNAINVFPVADGDTGTNLAFTMRTIVQHAKKDQAVDKTLQSISHVALENAYGNSGIIFAQYFRGLSIESKGKERISTREFASMVRGATHYTYKALAKPVEGTVLTVMRGFSDQLINNHLDNEWEKLFAKAYKNLEYMVEQTRYGLKVLRKNHVVDAGALGFMFFVEGILDFIRTGDTKGSSQHSMGPLMANHVNKFDEVKRNVYCSQFLVKSSMPAPALKELLLDRGEDLIVAQGDGILRVHIHTDYPDQIMRLLLTRGQVLEHRIEDMKLQSLILQQKDHTIAVVTDSIADLPQEYLWDQRISVIPLNVICDSVAYLDKLSMTPATFYKDWDDYELYPTSTQPSIDVIEKTLYALSMKYDSIIGLFVSSEMSGTYENVLRIAKEMGKNGYQISVIDSRHNSVGQGLLVKKMATLIEEGLEHSQIVSEIERIKSQVKTLILVQDLSYMLRGGRISKPKSLILSHITMKPVISIDQEGKGFLFKKTLTWEKGLAEIRKQIRREFNNSGISEYALVYADEPKNLEELREIMLEETGKPPSFTTQISSVVALNAGRGAIAVGYIKGEEL